MIGTVDCCIQAKYPNMPLDPMVAYKGSPSSIRVRNVPKRIGDWHITNVFFAVTYPDSSIRTVECVLVGGVWVGTIEGTNRSGTSLNGYTIFANGIDENGSDVTGYILGKGDVTILQDDGSVSPDPLRYYVKILSSFPVFPQEGDMFPTDDGYVIWQNEEAHSLGITFKQLSGYVNDAISCKAEISSVEALGEDIAEVSASLSDYYTKNETSSASEIQNALDAKQPSGDYALTSQIPTNVSQLSNDAGYLTEHQSLSDYYMKSETSSNVELDAKFDTKADLSALDEKQDKLSEAQLSAIDQDADAYLTKFYVQGESQVYAFIASSTLSKSDFAAQGVYDTTTGTWTKNLTAVKTGTHVTVLESNLFKDVTTLIHFEAPNFAGVQGAQAFGGCTGLQALILPKIDRIPANFCKDCTALRNLTIPASLNGAIGRNAFQNCTNLSVHFEEKSLAQVQAMLNYPWGLTPSNITASKTATQEWVEEQLPTNVSQLSNDAGYLTEHQSLSDYYTKSETSSNVELDAKFETKADLSTLSDYIHENANAATIQNLTCDTLVVNNAYINGYAKTSDLSAFVKITNPWTCGWRLTFNGTPTDDSLSARLNGRLIAYTDNRKTCRFDCVLDRSNISELYDFQGMDFQAFITINDLSNLVDGYTKNITGQTLIYTDAWGYYKNEVPANTEFDFLSVTFNVQE